MLVSLMSFGQKEKSTFQKKDDPKPNIKTDPLPEFPGDLNTYVLDNIKYPEKAFLKKIDGRVIVKYVVQADGFVGKVKVVEGIGYNCDEEAVSVVKSMPQWKPGEQNGKKVNTYYTLRVDFEYPEDLLVILEDRDAVFPGNIAKYIEYSMKYTQNSSIHGYLKTVIFLIHIDKYGYVTDIVIPKEFGKGMNDLAYRLIKEMPRWKPCVKNGKKVASLMHVIIDIE